MNQSHMFVILSTLDLPKVTMLTWRKSMERCWWHLSTVSMVPASILAAWSFSTCSTFQVSRRECPPLGEDYTLHIFRSLKFLMCVFFFHPGLQIWLLSTALSVRNMDLLTRTSGSVSGVHTLALSPPGSGER